MEHALYLRNWTSVNCPLSTSFLINHYPHKVVLETVLRVKNKSLKEFKRARKVIQFAISKDYAHPHSLNEDLLLAVWL